MRHVTLLAAAVMLVAVGSGPALADTDVFRSVWPSCSTEPTRANPWAVAFATTPLVQTPSPAPRASAVDVSGTSAAYAPQAPAQLSRGYAGETQAAAGRRPVPVEYSDGYKVRAKIHKIASFATLPLFIGQYVVGQDLYNNPGSATDSKRSMHGALAASTAVLFGVNSVTGAWNLWEGRKDPNHRSRRMTHGILMLIADAGFAATGATAPDSEEGRLAAVDNRSSHRTLALTSMGIALGGYLMMLFWRD